MFNKIKKCNKADQMHLVNFKIKATAIAKITVIFQTKKISILQKVKNLKKN